MDNLEPKKLALIRIWQIFHKYSDYDHPLTQDDIAEHLESDYGIVIERKAISRNISLLMDADVEIVIGDDCSTDNSYEIAQIISSNDERIKVFRHKKNQ